MGLGDRWLVVDPIGKSGGLLLGWNTEVTIYQIITTSFSIEVELESPDSNGKMWAIFVYASNKERIREHQWQELVSRKVYWGNNWILGGDFNDIRNPHEKSGGRIRSEASCNGFRHFIAMMDMEEIAFQGRRWTWANNWEEEGYIEVRLDRFFGANQWLLDHLNAKVTHVEKQSSDHSLLVLDTQPTQQRRKSWFYFDKRWVHQLGFEEVVRQAWDVDYEGSPMFQVASKIKNCRLRILEWNRQQTRNAAKRIQDLQEEMERMKDAGGSRDWSRCHDLRKQLVEAYTDEEIYWSQKFGEDRNTQFFMPQQFREERAIELKT